MIQIKVFANESCFKENRILYECILKSTDVSCSSLMDTFKVLYGEGIVVSFNFMPL